MALGRKYIHVTKKGCWGGKWVAKYCATRIRRAIDKKLCRKLGE